MGLYSFDGAKQDTDYTWQAFGRELIESEDLDPIYTMLTECCSLDDDTLKRWLLAYFCYYNAGVASRVAEMGSKQFYIGMRQGIAEKWPRGMERRYFWGNSAAKCVQYLEDYGAPETVVDDMTDHETFAQVSKAVTSFYNFGPWMGWKVADMAERVLLYPVDFSDATLGIYRDPVQGAAMVLQGDWREPITDGQLQGVVNAQIREFSDLLAPPYYDRPINVQEVETNLCKFKAHYKHHYPMGNDTYHVREALDGWGDLAQELLRWTPEIKPGHKGWEDGDETV